MSTKRQSQGLNVSALIRSGALVLSLSAAALSTNLFALPATMEMDRYLLAAENHLAADQYAQAENYLERAVSLQLALPDSFYFLYGEVLEHNGKVQPALEMLEKYLDQAGKEGEHYQQSLALITRIEEAKPKFIEANQAATAAVIRLENPEDDAWLDSLRKLYMSPSNAQALLLHINELLHSYSVSDARVLNTKAQPAISYQLSSQLEGQLQITKISYSEQGRQISNSRIVVYGLEPKVVTNCSREQNRCWVKHPAETSPWLQIRRDEKALEDLSRSMGALIRALQS